MIYFTVVSSVISALLFTVWSSRNFLNVMIKFMLFMHTVWGIVLSVKLSGIMDA